MKKNSLSKNINPQEQVSQSQLKSKSAGRLFLVSTPIGNLGDISARAIETLKTCDFVLAEDTRIGKKLLSAFGISKPVYRADEEATEKIIPQIIDSLEKGRDIALISDAGTPCVSDPGQRVSSAIIDAGFEIYPIPGASSVLAGLVASGIDAKQFVFLGFIPNKQKARQDFFNNYKSMSLTLIMFETGPRLLASLGDMFAVLGNRKIAVTRELTKLYEEKQRGQLADIVTHYQEKGAPKGEIVIIIEGAQESQNNYDDTQIEDLIKEAIKTQSVKDLSNEIAKLTGRKSRDIYEMAIKIKNA